MDNSVIREKIKQFLAQYINTSDLGDGDNLFASGRANSMFALRLVQLVEGNFEMKVEDQELRLENFSSVDQLVAFVASKMARQGIRLNAE